MTLREVDYAQMIHPDDSDQIIHLVTGQMDFLVQERIK